MKELEFPSRICSTNPKLAKVIITSMAARR